MGSSWLREQSQVCGRAVSNLRGCTSLEQNLVERVIAASVNLKYQKRHCDQMLVSCSVRYHSSRNSPEALWCVSYPDPLIGNCQNSQEFQKMLPRVQFVVILFDKGLVKMRTLPNKRVLAFLHYCQW